jgi:hypothetical protein
LQGKIAHGGNLHGNEEEGKKEETLVVGETILRTGRDFQPASQEKHFLRGVSFCEQLAVSRPVKLSANCSGRKFLHGEAGGVSQYSTR